MENFKKKPLKFMGLGKELRALELNSFRAESRHQRFSLLRCNLGTDIDSEDISNTSTKFKVPAPKENVKQKTKDLQSKIPLFSKPATSSRAEMLKKWKAEKDLKKQVDQKNKKPVFKVGILPCKPLLVTKDTSKSSNKTNLKSHQLSNLLHTSKPKPLPETKCAIKMKSTQRCSSRIACKIPQQKTTSGLPLPKPLQTKIPAKANLPTSRNIVKKSALPSATLTDAPKSGIQSSEASKQKPLSVSNRSEKPEEFIKPESPSKLSAPSSFKPVAVDKAKKDEIPKTVSFRCELSLIESSEPVNVSFAPPNFQFKPPVELNSSILGGASDLFPIGKVATRYRTSTPKNETVDLSLIAEVKKFENEVKSEDSLFLTDELLGKIALASNINTKPVIPEATLSKVKNICDNEESPKSHSKRLTRRTLRLSSSKSVEDIFAVSKPSYCSNLSSDEDAAVPRPAHSTITDGLEKLHLEKSDKNPEAENSQRYSFRMTPARSNRISLLYTPPRKSTLRKKSILKDSLLSSSSSRKSVSQDDLIAFSPS